MQSSEFQGLVHSAINTAGEMGTLAAVPHALNIVTAFKELESKLGAYQSLVDDLYAWAFSRADQTEIAAWIERAKELKK